MLIPFFSDTETKPSEAMRKAMATAEVGDEQKGEDPTVNELLNMVCELLGKEAALFLPTGTMCNLISIKAHTQAGSVLFTDHMSHILRAEAGGFSLVSGVHIEVMYTSRGIFSAHDLEEAFKRVGTIPWPYSPVPSLVCVEQTHNFGGGTVWSVDELGEVASKARELGLAVHMDGARLFNAAVSAGVPASEFTKYVDSVWIDFTKGLGAPMGAVLAGSRGFIEKARRYKHMFGGAMRQAGIVAAGCLYALKHNIDRLGNDHENARKLARGLSAIRGIRVLNPEPETNMVFFALDGLTIGIEDFLRELKKRGIAMSMVGNSIRAVTHLDISSDDVTYAISAVTEICKNYVKL